jgi:uncharacterized membrane protein YoaK (UPF0700 family)
VALGMSASAGFVDSGCYQRLHGTFTSHITGSTSSAVSSFAHDMWPEAERFAWAVASFLLGLLIGAALRRVEHRHSIRSAFAAVLALEILLLALFIACAGRPTFPVAPLIFFAAAAMGMQTVTVNRVGRLRIYTTFHTGSLSKFSEAFMEYLFWVRDRTRGRWRKRFVRVLRVTPRREAMQHAAVNLGVWLTFAGGALAGIPAVDRWGSAALVLAMAPLAVAIVVDWRRPRAVGEKDPGTDMQ